MQEKIELIKQEKISDLFIKGMDKVESVKNEAWLLLMELQKNCMIVDNIAYHDSIAGIKDFFHDYNIEFGAHDIPGSIDYPLLNTITDLLGVEYIYEYLRNFTMENDFLGKFSPQAINLLLKGFHKDSEHMLINLFELVLINALGCELLGLKITELNISAAERRWLQNMLKKLNSQEIAKKCEVALENLGVKLTLEEETIVYAKAAIPQLMVRVCHNLKTDTLQELFLTFPEQQLEEESFEVGIELEDEKLRELIDELKELSLISEKVARIRETVHSLNDFIELLEECFYENEYREVFQTLNETEVRE
jgi:hypothetical protein